MYIPFVYRKQDCCQTKKGKANCSLGFIYLNTNEINKVHMALYLKTTEALPRNKPVADTSDKEKARITDRFDKIVECDRRFNALERSTWERSKSDKLNPEIYAKKAQLKLMIKRQTWSCYNELAEEFSETNECDLVRALFDRLANIALGKTVDNSDSAKYAVLLLNTIFDEKKQLRAHAGFRPKVATIDDINDASRQVIDLLTEGSISMDVADRFHKLLSARVALLQNTEFNAEMEMISENLEKIKGFR